MILIATTFNFISSINSQKYYEKVEEKYSESFLEDVNNELSKYNKNTKIAYRFDLKPNIPYNRHLFINFAFLDLFGYTNFINNSKIDLSLIDNKLLYSNCEVCEYIKETNDTLNYQFNFLKRNKINILVTDKEQNDIPKKYIENKFSNQNEYIYFLKY